MPSGDAANGEGADRPGIDRVRRCWRIIGPTLLAFVGALLFIEILGPGYFVDAPPSAEKSGTPPIRADEGLVADLKAQVAEAEARIKERRARSNAAAIAAQQTGELGELNNQLSSARAAQADAHGKASLLKNALRQGRANEVPDIAKSETMRRIEGRRIALQAQLGRESRTFLWKHPRIKKLQAQLADVDAEWRIAAERDARVYENEARLASARVNDLQRVIEENSRIAGDASAQEAHLRKLERAARLVKEQLETETAKDQSAFVRERQAPSAAGIVQRVTARLFPALPRETVIIGLATLVAFILAIGAIVSRELLSGASRNIAPAQTRQLKFEATSQEDVGDAIASVRSPDSAKEITCLTRVACVKVLVAPCDANHKSQDAAIALGRNLARRGRALLIAADRGLTRIDALASPDGASKGLADLLIGEISYSDAIYRDAGSCLHVVPGGVGDSEESGDASESQDELESAINALAHAYDFLVVAGSSETARRLAPIIDLAFVIGGAEAENLRAELAGAGADAFLLEEGVDADDLIAAE
ncbi:hypothetical protein [Methylocystis sp. B8]|uniref:hypothetical protein n=1 Tax=Methylocystis sp. B8 TaxID=544938 RepID=UPI0010FD0E39|nr:hypothetical protein [Methylocystis sp. B8]TLG79052.1 hypothetical protein FEV16_03245 [Methylocystis sp. B8]